MLSFIEKYQARNAMKEDLCTFGSELLTLVIMNKDCFSHTDRQADIQR